VSNDQMYDAQPNALVTFIDRLPVGVRARLVALYRASLLNESSQILNALEREDLSAAGATAHKLWGGSANLQDERVAHVAKLIETAAAQGQLSSAKEAGLALRAACESSIKILDQYFDPGSSDSIGSRQ
jgi:HPt (histidine-containing phosphotransfer) domain-containing protein